MRWEKSSVHNGMFVMGTQGERIGKVIRCDPETFVVEKGVFFPKDYELRYDHITEVKDGTIVYSLTDFLRREDPFREATTKAASGGLAASAATAAAAATDRAHLRSAGEKEEIRIPLMKEEIGVEKVSRETGHVRIHKAVRTEERHFTVPVTREEVIIEHIAVAKDTAPAAGEAMFKEETVDLPLHEEEVRVTKRPMLREEVVVRTVSHAVDKEGAATLRYEEAEVEDTRKTATPLKEDGTGYTTPGYRR